MQRKVEGGSSYREILGEALAPPGMSQLCLQMGAAASRQEEEQHLPAGNGRSHGAYSWPGVNPFKKNFRRKKSYPHPSLCFLRPQGLGGQVTELFLAYLHNESFPRCVLGDTNPQRWFLRKRISGLTKLEKCGLSYSFRKLTLYINILKRFWEILQLRQQHTRTPIWLV